MQKNIAQIGYTNGAPYLMFNCLCASGLRAFALVAFRPAARKTTKHYYCRITIHQKVVVKTLVCSESALGYKKEKKQLTTYILNLG